MMFIIVIFIIIIVVIIIIWKGYFSVNPILSFCNFDRKKVLLLMWS